MKTKIKTIAFFIVLIAALIFFSDPAPAQKAITIESGSNITVIWDYAHSYCDGCEPIRYDPPNVQFNLYEISGDALNLYNVGYDTTKAFFNVEETTGYYVIAYRPKCDTCSTILYGESSDTVWAYVEEPPVVYYKTMAFDHSANDLAEQWTFSGAHKPKGDTYCLTASPIGISRASLDVDIVSIGTYYFEITGWSYGTGTIKVFIGDQSRTLVFSGGVAGALFDFDQTGQDVLTLEIKNDSMCLSRVRSVLTTNYIAPESPDIRIYSE